MEKGKRMRKVDQEKEKDEKVEKTGRDKKEGVEDYGRKCNREGFRGGGGGESGGGRARMRSVARWKIRGKHEPSLIRIAGEFSTFLFSLGGNIWRVCVTQHIYSNTYGHRNLEEP
jgi:hypothetical protein